MPLSRYDKERIDAILYQYEGGSLNWYVASNELEKIGLSVGEAITLLDTKTVTSKTSPEVTCPNCGYAPGT